jgi:hypothetical protein
MLTLLPDKWQATDIPNKLGNQILTLQSNCANNSTFSIYLLSNQMLTPVTSFTVINETTYPAGRKIQGF